MIVLQKNVNDVKCDVVSEKWKQEKYVLIILLYS